MILVRDPGNPPNPSHKLKLDLPTALNGRERDLTLEQVRWIIEREKQQRLETAKTLLSLAPQPEPTAAPEPQQQGAPGPIPGGSKRKTSPEKSGSLPQSKVIQMKKLDTNPLLPPRLVSVGEFAVLIPNDLFKHELWWIRREFFPPDQSDLGIRIPSFTVKYQDRLQVLVPVAIPVSGGRPGKAVAKEYFDYDWHIKNKNWPKITKDFVTFVTDYVVSMDLDHKIEQVLYNGHYDM